MKRITNLTWGLFNGSKKYPFYWMYRSMKDVRIAFKRLRFLLKNGYNEQALWETYAYMLDMWEDIFTFYRDKRNGTPFLDGMTPFDTDEAYDENDRKYNEILNRMLDNIKIMKIDDFGTDRETIEAAKKEFFKDFEMIFYHLWD